VERGSRCCFVSAGITSSRTLPTSSAGYWSPHLILCVHASASEAKSSFGGDFFSHPAHAAVPEPNFGHFLCLMQAHGSPGKNSAALHPHSADEQVGGHIAAPAGRERPPWRHRQTDFKRFHSSSAFPLVSPATGLHRPTQRTPRGKRAKPPHPATLPSKRTKAREINPSGAPTWEPFMRRERMVNGTFSTNSGSPAHNAS
jgi:hypothetical protein